jgi:hypothetical protein
MLAGAALTMLLLSCVAVAVAVADAFSVVDATVRLR